MFVKLPDSRRTAFFNIDVLSKERPLPLDAHHNSTAHTHTETAFQHQINGFRRADGRPLNWGTQTATADTLTSQNRTHQPA